MSNWKHPHPSFKLNGLHYNSEALYTYAEKLVATGQENEIDLGNFLISWLDDYPVVEVHTSGSTGKPKPITLRKEAMVASAKATGSYFEMLQGAKALLCLPASYIAGKMMVVRALVLGWELDTVSPSMNVLQNITKEYDFSAMVPLQLQNGLEKLNQIDTLIVGGAAVSPNLLSKLEHSTCKVYETYGMTETSTHIAVKLVAEGERHVYFNALPNVWFSQDQRGCLVIDAKGITEQSIVTNDLVALQSNTHFKWLGRYDTIINSGGVKLIPEKIEAKLSSIVHMPFFVAGIPDAYLGEKLVLLCEGVANTSNLEQQIRDLKILEKFEVPKTIVCIPSFKRTKTGKINRKATIELLSK